MNIANKLTIIDNALANIKDSIIKKGQTPTGNITTYAEAIENISSGEAHLIGLTVVPSTDSQTILPPFEIADGFNEVYVTPVTNDIDNNIKPENIKKDITILNVTGTYEASGHEPVIESLSVTPSTINQTITAPSSVDGYSPITVNAVTSSIDFNIRPENIRKDVSILGVTGNYIGNGKYPLRRIKDDSNNEIGTAFMQFTDGNNNTYEVVCLDAQYRANNTQWASYRDVVIDLPMYANSLTSWWYDDSKETATRNTQLILDWCNSNGYTSSACSHCRSKSFTIGGITYYGQLPNMREVFDMWMNRTGIESLDSSATNYTTLNFSTPQVIWSSTQYSDVNAWHLYYGSASNTSKTYGAYKTCPVLEIPVPSIGEITDNYTAYVDIENTIKGTSYDATTEVETACDDILEFIYGTNN